MLNCPVCKETALADRELEPNLNCSSCSNCGGSWISSSQYDQWLTVHGEKLPEKAPEEGVKLVSGEKAGIKFCPECKTYLVKYKVGHGVEFSLNRCGRCGGVWFDKNEWEIMKSRNLHDEVHLVFSQAWQSSVREDEHKAAMDEILGSQLGEADFKEVQRIRNWLKEHPKSAELYAYLLADSDAGKKSSTAASAGSSARR
jgi:Zn-finger nucleic acid-binding protein